MGTNQKVGKNTPRRLTSTFPAVNRILAITAAGFDPNILHQPRIDMDADLRQEGFDLRF